MPKIAILDDYQNVALSYGDWQNLPASCELTVFNDHQKYGDALIQRLQPFDILCIMRERTPFPRTLLAELPNLKLLITSGMRNASIDVAAAHELGIKVCGTKSPGYAAPELALGLILALARGLLRETDSFRGGGWQVGLGRDLNGSTLGILGLGRLGSKVAGYGKAFGMHVIAWSQNLTDERAKEFDVVRVSKEALFSQSDFLTIHLKLGERSLGLVDAQALGLMKPSAYLINTARGPIVDQDALIEALENKTIAGAAIDVYDEEPLPADHPLRHTPNLIATPHIGYVTEQTYQVFYTGMIEILQSYLAGDLINELA